jgi:hypothetical protein
MSGANGEPPPKKAYSIANYFRYARPGEIIAAGAVLAALSFLIVCLRIFTRLHKKARIELDDILIVPAMVCRALNGSDLAI